MLLPDQRGSSLLETALVLPALLLMIAVAVDLGHACTQAVAVNSAAHAGAVYGLQHPADRAGMIAAAKLDAGTLTTLTPTASFGCECPDGSSPVDKCSSEPTCPMNSVLYTEVDTSFPYHTLLPYPGLPDNLVLRAKSRLRSSR
jgi:hypothetical protein